MLNLLIILPTVIIFIPAIPVYIFLRSFFSMKTVLTLTSFLLFDPHFFLPFPEEAAALAMAAFVFLPEAGCFPYEMRGQDRWKEALTIWSFFLKLKDLIDFIWPEDMRNSYNLF